MSALVTGASTGIGRAIATRLARPRRDVFVHYYTSEGAALETAAAVNARGGRAHLCKADLSTIEGCEQLAEHVTARTARLDHFVHCAAVPVGGALVSVAPAALAASIAVNGSALAHVARGVDTLLGDGTSIVYISGRGSRRVIPGYGPLGVPKALGEAIAMYLAVELGSRGIRVNVVCPGTLDTPAFRSMFPDDWAARLDRAAQRNPAGRAVDFEEVAALVERLGEPGLAMVRGQRISIDGGVSLLAG